MVSNKFNNKYKQLKRIYYNPRDPGSYGGFERLYRRAREMGIKRHQVECFLKDQHSYSLHKPCRHRFTRNKTIVAGIDSQWQADLADMQSLSRYNQGYKYILFCIDIFSRYAWALPVKNKTGKIVGEAFQTIFDISTPRIPEKLQTDKGREFFNKNLKQLLDKKSIKHFASWSDQKAALCERLIRTIKTRIWNYFTAMKSNSYIDILQKMISSYNNSKHRSLGMAPSAVKTIHEVKLWNHLYGNSSTESFSKSNHIKRGQKVRISRVKGNFEKGYMPNWSEEDFIISGSNKAQNKRLYKIEDHNGENIDGTWYKEELQPIEENEYRIEKVLRKRTNKSSGITELLIKWKGWPVKFNSWISEADIIKEEEEEKVV